MPSICAKAPGTVNERFENLAVPFRSRTCPFRSESTVSSSPCSPTGLRTLSSRLAPTLRWLTPSWVLVCEKVPASIPKVPCNSTLSKKGRLPGGMETLARKLTLPDIGERSERAKSNKRSWIRPSVASNSMEATLPGCAVVPATLPCDHTVVFQKVPLTRWRNVSPFTPLITAWN